MKLLSVEGMFHDCKIELSDMPLGMDRARVIVTFLEPPNPAPVSHAMKLGMFAGPGMSSDDDFKMAEWRGEPEFFGDGYGDQVRG